MPVSFPHRLTLSPGVTAFIQRISGALGLNAIPSYHFRYSRYFVDEDTTEAEINDWEPYSTTDQLSILAKVVLSYQHRDTEPSFTMMLKGNHLITVGCSRIGYNADGSRNYRFGLTMNTVTTYMQTHTHTPHGLQFVLAPGAQNPFPQCQFEWVPSTTV